MDKQQVNWIDPVNWVTRMVPGIADEPIELSGMTVRALIAALQQADPDDLVVYMCEQLPATRDAQLLLGVIGGLLSEGNCGASFIVGPEAIKGMRKAGMIE